MLLGRCQLHFVVAVLALMLSGGQSFAQEGQSSLACRFASYGQFKESAWTHLPLIGVHHVFMNVPTPAELDATLARLKDNHLKALVIRGDVKLTNETYKEDLESQLGICEKMGVHYMFLSVKGQDAPREMMYARLREAGEIAMRHGIILSLETHPPLGTNAEVHLETMKAVNHPNVRVNFDSGNITFYNQGTDACTELEKIIDYVATVELKDHDGKMDSWTFPPVGQGVVDMPRIMKILADHNYKGPITLEFEGVKGVELDETATKKAIAESVAYVRSLACLD